MPGLTPHDVNRLLALLDRETARIHARADRDNATADLPQARDPGDQADEAEVQTELRDDDAMLDHYRMELADIEAARQRIRQDTYGICADCGSRIPLPRLLVHPTATRCTPCQRRREHLFGIHAR